MTGTIALIAAALGLIQPKMSQPVRVSFATMTHSAAKVAGVDPLLLLAMAEHESRWEASVLGGLNGQCVGLMQICLHTFPVCRADFAAPACVAQRDRLREPTYNMSLAGKRIAEWRALCSAKTGHAEPRHWLSGYGGFDSISRGIVCGQRRVEGAWRDVPSPKAVRDVLAQRLQMKRAFRR